MGGDIGFAGLFQKVLAVLGRQVICLFPRKTVIFKCHLDRESIDRLLPAGSCEVITDEELMEGSSMPLYRCVGHQDDGAYPRVFTQPGFNGDQAPFIVAMHSTDDLFIFGVGP